MGSTKAEGGRWPRMLVAVTVVVMIVVATVAGTRPADGETRSDAPRTRGSGPVSTEGLPSAEMAKLDAIGAKLATSNPATARVLVGLRVDSTLAPSEAAAQSPAAIADYQSQIATAQANVTNAIEGAGATVTRRYTSVPAVAMTVDATALDRLRTLPGIDSVTLDEAVPPTLAQSVPLIQGTVAQAAGYNGSGWSVAILDTGIDKTHPFLSGKVVAEACFSANGNCPNGQTSMTGSGAGVPCPFAGNCNHGTHVAGITGGSNTSFTGVAPGATIISVQVFSQFSGSDCNGTGFDPCAKTFYSDQVAGLDWVYSIRATRNIASVNMSLGGGQFFGTCDSAFPQHKTAIDNLRSAGIATVIATGNNGFVDSIGGPSCVSSAIRVSSTDKSDNVSSFANVSSLMNLFAPGTSINSSVPGGSYAVFNGTSMATPHVAGAWAVLKQRFPADSVTTALGRMTSTGLPITDLRTGGTVTAPRIQLADALGLTNPPPNDDFANATTFTAASATPLVGANVAATKQPGEPNHAGSSGGKSVWWSFTAPSAGNLTLSTQGSSFDTLLAAYTGSAVGSLTEIASNDDFQPPERWSRVSFAAASGQTYRIAVDGYSGASGSVALGFTWTGLPPPNDNFANAIAWNPTDGSATSGSNASATKETGEPNHAGRTGGRSVWWRFTPATDYSATLSTAGSSFDTILAVYTGPNVASLTEVASNDDEPNLLTSRVTFEATAGTTYFIAVDGYGAASGAITLTANLSEALRFRSLSPARIQDSRPGGPQVGPYSTPWGPGTTRDVQATGVGGVPSGADAVVLNVTATKTTAASFLTIFPAGTARPLASNLNWTPGRTIANAVTVKVGASGRIAIYNPSGDVDVVVDVVGYYQEGSGDLYTSLSPSRIQDSRPGGPQVGPYSTPWGPGTTREVQATGVGGVPPGATAVVLNVTATRTTAASFLTVFPAGTAPPLASSLNWTAGQTIANAVTVKVSASGRIAIYNPTGATDVIIDVVGYFTAGSGKRFHAASPRRIQDSRPSGPPVGPYSSPWGPGTTRDVQVGGVAIVPAGADSALVNMTVTNTTASSFLTVYPSGSNRPVASSLNWTAGLTIPNAVTVKVGQLGAVAVYNPSGTVDVIADLAGWYD
ncbi:MAG: S8 family serine peptidase [Actinobacteria bacterium]|nr:S8 family serine peptidase [Actinomycetota bacterium]